MGYLDAMGTSARPKHSGVTDRSERGRLAEQQAALRRVATLVAEGARAADVFSAVAQEVTEVLHLPTAAVCRYDDDDTVVAVLAASGDRPPGFAPGSRWPLDGPSVSAEVLRTGRPTRLEDYAELRGTLATEAREGGFDHVAGAPIIVDGRVWGVILTSMSEGLLPDNVEDRLAEFTELVATAIANSQAREELKLLAEEQAALRRVATLVAQGASPADVFEAVTAEIAQLVPAEGAVLTRFEDDDTVIAVGAWTRDGGYTHVGTRFELEGTVSGRVFASGRPARIEGYAEEPGEAAAAARELGWRFSVGAPITVENHLWGVLAVVSTSERPPPETEPRLAEFTELVAVAIANAESRAELDASRARIVATADATRRRIERDLHDGAQQQLVSLALELRAVRAATPPEHADHLAELTRIDEGLTAILDGLREIALGIHPAILAEGGIGPALGTLGRRSPIPVELDVRTDSRLPEPIEVAAYYVVSEALTNAAKHSNASIVRVTVEVEADRLLVGVRDDGVGGADTDRGSGLVGLRDRAEAVGGSLTLESPPGRGTFLALELPLADGNHQALPDNR
jgi:signal transduction histidine kinase